MRKILFVVTGGAIGSLPYFRSKVAELKPVGIICADSGAGHLYPVGLIPDIIIGDMDSLGPELLNHFKEQGSLIITYPEAKNETDTELALDYAIGMGPDDIYVFGACGTRIDHTLANLSLLVPGIKSNVKITLIDEWCEIFMVSGKHVIEGEAGQTVSLLPFSGTVTGITLEGFEYPIENGVMEIGKPYGVSNRLKSSRGVITIGSGHLLVTRYFKAGLFP
ncbi:MAG: thiamine diphosphokinase [Deltaproteobacteria bacterium]